MPTAMDRASIRKGGAALLVFATAGWLINESCVRFWWNFVDYDGDMPIGIIVVLQHFSLLFEGIVPLGVALIVAGHHGHLRSIPLVSMLLYSGGAGALWMGVPLIVGSLLPTFSGPFRHVGSAVVIAAIAASYFVLLVGLGRVRRDGIKIH
jgi:hypothetical protein